MSQSPTTIDNSAGRLHALLCQLSKVDPLQPTSSSIFQALNVEDWPSFYKLLAKILILIEETEFNIQSLEPRKQDIYIKFLAEIRAHLSICDWNQQWANIAIPFHNSESSLMCSLELCAFDLERKDNSIDDQNLAQLRKSVEDLLHDISLSTEVSPELKLFLLEKLREVRRAIDDYVFYGSQGLRKTLESILGASSLQGDEIKDLQNSTIKKFWDIIKNMSTILSVVNNLEKIAPNIQDALEAVTKLGPQ
jgi:hypothetical protein